MNRGNERSITMEGTTERATSRVARLHCTNLWQFCHRKTQSGISCLARQRRPTFPLFASPRLTFFIYYHSTLHSEGGEEGEENQPLSAS